METIVYYNGKYSSFTDALIPLSDRSIFFGDAVYDVIIGKLQGGLYQLDLHLKRLYDNASFIGIKPNEDIRKLVLEASMRATSEYYSVYIQLSRLGAERNHVSNTPEKANILIIISEVQLHDTNTPISAITCEDKRYALCNIKTTNLLPAILASHRARGCGADEAIFIRDGFVTEGAKSNCFIINDNLIITRPKDSYILPGITRENLIRTATLAGFKIREEKFTKKDLFSADEILITSTTKFVKRINLLDGAKVGMKNEKTAKCLQELLENDFKKMN